MERGGEWILQTMVFTVFSDVWIIQNVRNYSTFQHFCVFPSAKHSETTISSFGALQKNILFFREICVFPHVLTNQTCAVAPFLFSPFCHASDSSCPHAFSKFACSSWVNLHWNDWMQVDICGDLELKLLGMDSFIWVILSRRWCLCAQTNVL